MTLGGILGRSNLQNIFGLIKKGSSIAVFESIFPKEDCYKPLCMCIAGLKTGSGLTEQLTNFAMDKG